MNSFLQKYKIWNPSQDIGIINVGTIKDTTLNGY